MKILLSDFFSTHELPFFLPYQSAPHDFSFFTFIPTIGKEITVKTESYISVLLLT